MIEKLDVADIKPSSRRYPAIIFDREREAGDQILNIEGLAASIEGEVLFQNIDINLNKGEKVVLFSKDSRATTAFYEIVSGKLKQDTGKFQWGVTTSQSYLPLDNEKFFEKKMSLVDWLRQWAHTEEERDAVYLRGFLGKMLFSGDEALKSPKVLSGGEKVRCMLSKMMFAKANLLLMDEPTNHLDLESITALNQGMEDFKGTLLFTSHDHELVNSVANRIVEITPNGIIDKMMPYDDYLKDDKIAQLQEEMYA
mgnify:CR=1 FL=1